MIRGSSNDFKKYLVEKTRKSPFYTMVYEYILNTYKSPIIDTFSLNDIKTKFSGGAPIDSSEYYYTDNESVKRNLQKCIEQVISDLCSEGKIKQFFVEGSNIPSYVPNYPEKEIDEIQQR